MAETKLSLIVVIINGGYSDELMEIVKNEGARGGTIINAIGSVRKDAEKLYGITINPDKELILLIVDKTIRNKMLKAIYTKAGKDSPMESIAFSMPVEKATSNLLSQYTKKDEQKPDES